ncbi:hypothetical protein PIB30_064912 [Stylosanthes scabra]|uniref:Uncharacterized protein n=1 Tax=Stylosanthes scabra TaxID=79078 RepID=A0ABU6SMB9_9FABA|nr:hypothetical protein [Stylosanthes scabra]
MKDLNVYNNMQPSSIPTSLLVDWIPPHGSVVKINCDASLFNDSLVTGFGCLIRDSNRAWIKGCLGTLPPCTGCSRVTGIRLPDRIRTDPIILVQYPTGASLPHSFEPFIIRTNPNGASHTPTGHSHRPTPRPTAHGPPRNPTFPPIPSRDVADTEGDTTPRLASSPRQLFIVSSRRQVSPSHAASASPRLRHVSIGLKLVAAPLLRFVVAPNLVEVVLIPPHAR